MRRSASCRPSSRTIRRGKTEPSTAPPPSLYLHVPFCRVRCGYCDFNTFARTPSSPVAEVVQALCQELARAPVPPAPPTVFLGGGTPTELTEHELAPLLGALHGTLAPSHAIEFTVEANPETATPARARLLRQAGANRVSIGAQSFDARRLRFLDRPHGPEAIGRAVEAFRVEGFHNLNLDLIFGLPGQTPTQWAEDLEAALALGPDHLSCYQLTFEAGTPLALDLARGRIAPPPEETAREMFLHTRRRLAAAGFEAYEISNYALPGKACRHNLNYWRTGDYHGLGPGAASHRDGVRSTNVRPLPLYLRLLREGLPPTESAETLPPALRLAEAACLGLRTSEGISLPALSARFGLPAAALLGGVLDRLADRGLVRRDGDGAMLTEEGILFADTVAGEVLAAAAPTDTPDE